MFKYIIIALLAIGVSANSEFSLKYFIDIDNHFKGVLVLDEKGDSADAIYHNISQRDRIPFYAPTKEFSFTKLNKKPTLATLHVKDFKKRMVYNVAALGAEAMEDAGISKVDMASSAIIYDKEDSPSDVTEKRVIHTFESLVLSIFDTKKIPKDSFYLFEPHKNMLMKVKFSKESTQNIKLANKVCSTTSWVLNLVGRNKRLIRIYANPYPIKVESFTKKWSFELAGAGTQKELTLMKKDIAFKAFKKSLEKKYNQYNLNILNQSVVKDIFKITYQTKFRVSKEISSGTIKNSLSRYLRNSLSIKSAKNAKNAFTFSVSKDDVQDILEKRYDLEDKNHYWRSSTKQTQYNSILKMLAKKQNCKADLSKQQLKCDGKDEKVDFEDHLKEYLAQIPKLKGIKYKISDIEENDDEGILEYSYKSLVKISNRDKVNAVQQAFENKYKDVDLSNANILSSKSMNKYVIYIPKLDVANFVCKNAIPNVVGTYKNKMCVAQKIQKNTQSEANRILDRYMDEVYPDLKILNIDVKNEEDRYRFNYLNDLSKVTNGCR